MTPPVDKSGDFRVLATTARLVPRLVPLAGAALAGIYAGHVAFSEANHENPGVHVRSMHTSGNGYNEIYCIDKTDASQVDISDVQSKLNAVLKVDSTSEDWENSDGSWRIYFESVFSQTATHDCDQLTQGWRDATIIEFHLSNNNAVAPCTNDDNISCVQPYTAQSANGHTDYKYFSVFIDTDHFYPGLSLRRHTVNHELGHVFGLLDPPPCNDGNGNWIPSIMHSNHYCGNGNPEWPAQIDRDSVKLIMDQLAAGK